MCMYGFVMCVYVVYVYMGWTRSIDPSTFTDYWLTAKYTLPLLTHLLSLYNIKCTSVHTCTADMFRRKINIEIVPSMHLMVNCCSCRRRLVLFPHVMEVLMSQVMSSDDPYKLEEQPGDTQLDQTSILFLIQELKLFPYSLHTRDVSSVSARPFMLQIVYTQDIWQGTWQQLKFTLPLALMTGRWRNPIVRKRLNTCGRGDFEVIRYGQGFM